MKRLVIFLLVVFGCFYLSQKDMLPSVKSYINLKNIQPVEQGAQQMYTFVQQELFQKAENQTSAKPPKAMSSTSPVSNSKYPVKQIQTYQVAIKNGKLVVSGGPTPYGQFNKADGVILYIQEVRANKKATIKVPFENGRIYYEYALTYTVGDVILNLNEYYNGKPTNPNLVLGYVEYHLTDGDPFLSPSFMVQSNNSAIKALAQNITKGLATNTEKSRAIFTWVAQHISYNVPLVNDPNPPFYSALTTYRTRVVLCTGYADLSAALHRAAGIEAKVVYGQNHAWNEIKLNGIWQTEDPTNGSGFINSNTMQFVRSYHPTYFYKTIQQKQGEYPW